MKILVLKRDKIGDLLLTTPLLAQLKAGIAGVQTHLLANDYNAWVVAGNPHIDRVWVYRRVRHAGRVSIGAAWQWTSSAYLGYPGFKTFPGSVGEYNGKFMIDQIDFQSIEEVIRKRLLKSF